MNWKLLPLDMIGILQTIVAGLFGMIFGSFLNVVIHRLPKRESIVFPSSRCPSCGTAIKPYDNIPVISYLILRGRCRSCHVNISARYPAVEALTGLLWAIVYMHDGFTPILFFDLVFVTAIMALIFIDAELMILPDAITYPGFLFALVTRLVIPNLDGLSLLMYGPLNGWPLWSLSLIGALIGALLGGGSLWLTGWVWERLRGIEAMGLGDVKMMLMVGAYLGWRLTILTIFFGVVTGSLAGIALMLIRRERNMQMLLPFGIFLGFGAIGSLLIGSPIVEWYASQFRY
jgi:leader peptidase (prepilin peptidase) / N-methyltransferase